MTKSRNEDIANRLTIGKQCTISVEQKIPQYHMKMPTDGVLRQITLCCSESQNTHYHAT